MLIRYLIFPLKAQHYRNYIIKALTQKYVVFHQNQVLIWFQYHAENHVYVTPHLHNLRIRYLVFRWKLYLGCVSLTQGNGSY